MSNIPTSTAEEKYSANVCFEDGFTFLHAFAQFRKHIIEYTTASVEDTADKGPSSHALMDKIHERMEVLHPANKQNGYWRDMSYVDFSLRLTNNGLYPLFDFDLFVFPDEGGLEIKHTSDVHPTKIKEGCSKVLFEGSKYLKLVPKNCILSPGESLMVPLSVKSGQKLKTSIINWHVLSECFSFSGKLELTANPVFHELKKTVLVEESWQQRTEVVIEEHFEWTIVSGTDLSF